MRDRAIPQTGDDKLDNVRTSLNRVFQIERVEPLMCHYKGHL